MQCPIGNAAPGHALGQVEVVKLSQADGGSGSTRRFCWKISLSSGPHGTSKLKRGWRVGAEKDSWSPLYEHQRPCQPPRRTTNEPPKPEMRTNMKVLVCLWLGVFLEGSQR